MKLIINSKTKELQKLREEITSLQQEILPLQNVTQFAELDQQLNEKVNKIYMDTVTGKKEKLLCDKLEYELNNVYVWKKRRQWGRYVNFQRNQVSFSDTELEIMYNTLAVTASDDSFDQPGVSSQTN